jgi:hypothetical protein
MEVLFHRVLEAEKRVDAALLVMEEIRMLHLERIRCVPDSDTRIEDMPEGYAVQ